MPYLKYNADASKRLVAYVSQAFQLRRTTAHLTVATRDTIIQSRALLAELDALRGVDPFRMSGLWFLRSDSTVSRVPEHPE
jgi:hypothetical protein